MSYLGEEPESAQPLAEWFDHDPPEGESTAPAENQLESSGDVGHASPTKHYAICADSLASILDTATHRYDVVIIDEVEQVIAHLLAQTMQANRRLVIHTLCFYLRKAREIYVLDADLNQVAINVLSQMVPADQWSVRVLINRWQSSDRTLTLYNSKPQLIGELVASLRRGERCFVCSNSKRLVKSLEARFRADLGSSHRIIAVTAENAHQEEIQELIRDIRNRAQEYDVILASPALGTGIDITFEGDAQRIDTVFGVFEGRINTHFDIDQQLSRVRNPKRICVWVDPREYHFETDVSAIRAEIEAAEAQHATFMWINDNGHHVYHRDAVYETIFAEVTALQRASRNRLLHNFIELRQHNGWEIARAADDKTLRAHGKEVLAESKATEAEREHGELLTARQLDGFEYEALQVAAAHGNVSREDESAMRRYEIEKFYRQELTTDLLVKDAHENLRQHIRNIELVLKDDRVLEGLDRKEGNELVGDRSAYMERKRVLTELLRKANLLTADDRISTSVVIKMDQLRAFAEYCRDSKPLIERLFDVAVRGDVMRNPVQQLSVVLDLFGLPLDKEGIGKQRGKKIYKYKVNEEALAERMVFVERRASRTSSVVEA